MLQQLGLNTTGGRKAMEARHRRYVMLHNANLDALQPRSAAAIVRSVHREEDELRRQGSSRTQVQRMAVSR